MRALTIADVARELGRSTSWLYDNWPALVAEKKIPRPLIEKGGCTWSAAQFYAFQDRNLTAAQRVAAAAYRAAHDAAIAVTQSDLDEADAIAQSRERIDARLSKSGLSGSRVSSSRPPLVAG